MKKIILMAFMLFSVNTLAKESLYSDDYIVQLKKIDNIIDTGIPNYVKASTLTSANIKNILRFKPIFFDDREISARSMQRLEDIINLISKKSHSSYISLLGHSSSHLLESHHIKRSAWAEFWQKVGGEEMSQDQSIALVNARLRTVYNKFKAKGIRIRNIYTENRTDSDPIATEESAKGIAMNNRVDIALYLKGNINLHINFKLDSSVITSYYDKRVKAFARFLINNRDYKSWIIGHTDEQAGYEYNMALSKRRANATKALLVSLGVYPSQLRTIGKGESEPLDRRSNKIAYRKNRRIEAQVIEP